MKKKLVLKNNVRQWTGRPVLESFYKPHKRRKIFHDMFLDMLLW